jgi:hypothetical protein
LKQEVDRLGLPIGWPRRPPVIAGSMISAAFTYAEEVRGACAAMAGSKAAEARTGEDRALEKLNQAKARLAEAKQKVEDLKKAPPTFGEEALKSAENLRIATEAVTAATKEIEAVTAAITSAKSTSGSAGEAAAKLKAELDAARLDAARARGDAQKRRSDMEKARAELESDPRTCPEYLCGEQPWSDQWPYYTKASVLWVLTRGIGWLVTALAAALGAQFWFDVLSKITQLRSSKKPEEPTAAPTGGAPVR